MRNECTKVYIVRGYVLDFVFTLELEALDEAEQDRILSGLRYNKANSKGTHKSQSLNCPAQMSPKMLVRHGDEYNTLTNVILPYIQS